MIELKNQIHFYDIYEEVVDCFKENNPKFFESLLHVGKSIKKIDSNVIPYKYAYSKMSKETYANSEIKLSYINRHFCYAIKTTTPVNGLVIITTLISMILK